MKHQTPSPSLLSGNLHLLVMDSTSVRQWGVAGLSAVPVLLYLWQVYKQNKTKLYELISLWMYVAPELTLFIRPGGSPTAGQTYTLTCDVVGDELLAVTRRRLRWDRVTPSPQMEIFRSLLPLTFDSFSNQDEGEYRCVTTISSPYLTTTRSLSQTRTISVVCKLLKTLNMLV